MSTDIEFWDELFTKGQKFRPLKDEVLDAILARIGQPGSVADIGAGTGSLVLALAERGIDTTAFDISGVALGMIAETAAGKDLTERIHTVQSDINDADFGHSYAAAFDIIFMKLAIAFAHDRDQVLTRVRTMLRPGGSLVIITPVLLESQQYDDRQMKISVPRQEFQNQLKKHFSDVQVFSESNDDPNWPLVIYICTHTST